MCPAAAAIAAAALTATSVAAAAATHDKPVAALAPTPASLTAHSRRHCLPQP